eukprot:83109-Pyramimonas_sp.AAC.1
MLEKREDTCNYPVKGTQTRFVSAASLRFVLSVINEHGSVSRRACEPLLRRSSPGESPAIGLIGSCADPRLVRRAVDAGVDTGFMSCYFKDYWSTINQTDNLQHFCNSKPFGQRSAPARTLAKSQSNQSQGTRKHIPGIGTNHSLRSCSAADLAGMWVQRRSYSDLVEDGWAVSPPSRRGWVGCVPPIS